MSLSAASDQEQMKGDAGDVERLRQTSTYIQKSEIDGLPQGHRDYLLRRHGTLELDPVPDWSDADPYNWPSSKVRKVIYPTSLLSTK